MPTENANAQTRSRKTSLFGLPISWGTQLTIAILGAAFFWWLDDVWIQGRRFPGVTTLSERLWQIAPSLLLMALTLLCLFWVAALFIKIFIWTQPQESADGPVIGSESRKSASLGKRLLSFFLFTVVIAAFDGGSAVYSYAHFPSEAGKIAAVTGILSLLAIFILTPRVMGLRRADKEIVFPAVPFAPSEMRRYGPPAWWTKPAAQIPTIVFLLVFFAPFQWLRLPWRLAALVGVVLWSLGLNRLKFWIYLQSRKGDHDRALRLNRICAWIPGYGTSYEGLILFDAGRNAEACQFLKPLVFDSAGQPRLESLELYVYCLALINDGYAAEAEPLLEAALRVKRPADSLEIALASCLLTQRKDAVRACLLIEKAMGTPELRISNSGRQADHAARVARFAWALGAAGRKDEAQSKIQEALAAAANLKSDDAASVQYFIGEAWEALGNTPNSRSAYQSAIELRPEGVTAVSARNGLDRLKLLQ
jgi:tetratricopeptide (TPR) repeat protein